MRSGEPKSLELPGARLVERLFPHAPPAIEIELTTLLVSSTQPIRIMGAVAAMIGVQAALNRDPLPAGLMLSFALVALVRVLVLRRNRRRYGTRPPGLAVARRWEHGYAAGSFASSLLFGVANFNILSYRDAPLALLAVCLLCCYVFSLILRTAVRPLVCLPSVAIALALTLAGLPLFLHQSHRLAPAFASMALATVAVVMVLSCVQLSAHVYRATVDQLLARRDLLRFARQDPLTGLDNRLALRERFDDLSPGPTRPAALLYLDLDGFKPINDVHGHELGDKLLREVATRLVASIRPGDSVFRIGGDEFIVLLPKARQRSDTTAMARRLLALLSEPYAIDGVTVRIGVSIGIALADAADADLDDLAASADAALYDAKRSGRGTFRFAETAPRVRLVA